MTEIISKLDDIKEENRSELVDILDSYFDPEKEAIVPPSKPTARRRSFKKGSPRKNRRNGNGDKLDKKHSTETNNNNVGSPPDSTLRSPRRNRRFRKRLSGKQLGKKLNETADTINSQETQPIAKSTTAMPQTAPEIAVA